MTMQLGVCVRNPGLLRRTDRRKVQEEGFPTRPSNQFLLFRTEYYRTVAEANARPVSPLSSTDSYTPIQQNDLSVEAGVVWKSMSYEEQAPYRVKAAQLMEEWKIAVAEFRDGKKKRDLVNPPKEVAASPVPAPLPQLVSVNTNHVPLPGPYLLVGPSFGGGGLFFPFPFTFSEVPVVPSSQGQFSNPLLASGGSDQVYAELCAAYLQVPPLTPASSSVDSFNTSSPNLDVTLGNICDPMYQVPLYTNDPNTNGSAMGQSAGLSYIASEDAQTGFGFRGYSYPLYPQSGLVACSLEGQAFSGAGAGAGEGLAWGPFTAAA